MSVNNRAPHQSRRTIALALSASFALSIISYYNTLKLSTASSLVLVGNDVPSSLLDPRSLLPLYRNSGTNPLDEADFIIQRAYAETYARMAPCKGNEIETDCIRTVVNHFNQQKNEHNQQITEQLDNSSQIESILSHPNSKLTPLPWWFQTLLRDIPINGAYGFWHHFSTSSTTPPIKFCAIGKNGSTEWRKVFKALNAPEFGGLQKSKFNTHKKLSEDTQNIPQTVFLRDPLERLLSAYLDKCVKDSVRRSQGHCEPNAIFASDWMKSAGKKTTDDKSVISLPMLFDAAQDADKEMFAAYVDLFPLKWNVHFVPQAIFCDLYRNINNYDVYFMGKSFMPELDRMSSRYGGLLPETLNDIFQYKSHIGNVTNGSEGNVGANNSHGTKAPTKVAKYYSPRALRRALEYLSIDYVTLKLEVPEWAREMLRKDNSVP
ncbi:hypothetical protein HJC23_002347 [Cyclotella cryptica]|uniref:Carbohydrate sulfotransferase n=1 Tax=Cyclotella cryptica TaxID=29204 RepID=A0ABD3QKQ5_9STRA|eukprot:CCRYP_004443-RA/>CCRYP_004443-RA protein AED:0.38 eAED:0.38 QI:0/-1/0/1/-1/1/1/0/433